MAVGYPVLEAVWLAPKVRRMVVSAERVTRHWRPGQFVIVRPLADSERIPLTIARADREKGTILLIVQSIGATTTELATLGPGQSVHDVAGPLGRPTDIEKLGHVVVVGGGVGTAVVLPQAAALKACGNKVSAVIGGRSREYVILEDELKKCCDAVYPCTDDGSYGFHGFVTDRLRGLMAEVGDPVKAVYTAGPVPMMRAVAEVTRPAAIPTVASLNPIMVDGTGMCGGCRVQVGGRMQFACVDGPEFDAHKVDFGELTDRLSAYRDLEKEVMERHQHHCHVRNAPEGSP